MITSAKKNFDFRQLHKTTEIWMILTACYVLSFGTFHHLATMRGAERMEAPVTLTFDLVSAIKTVTRIVAFTLVAWGLLRARRSPKWQLLKRDLFPLALFGLWGIASTLWSPMPLFSFGHALEFTLLVMMAALAALVCDDAMRFGRALFHLTTIHFLLIVALVVLAIAAPSYARILRSDIESEAILYTGLAGTSYLMNSFQISVIASLGLILVIASTLLWNFRWARVLFLPALMVEGWVLFATQTRTVVATTLLLAAACLVFWGRGKLLAMACLSSALIGTIYLTLDPSLVGLEAVGDKMVMYMSRGQGEQQLRGLSGRVSNWSQVINAFPESPIVGHGYSMATPSGKMWHEGVLRHYSAHNILLRVLAGTGLVGGILFIWGFGRLFLSVCRGLLRFRDKRLPFLNLLIIGFVFLNGAFGDSIVGPLDVTSLAIFVLLGIGISNPAMAIGVPSAPLKSTFKSKSSARSPDTFIQTQT